MTKSISHQPIGTNDAKRFEKLHVEVFENSADGSIAIASEIAELIKSKKSVGKHCVLGLATGSSPIRIYAELVKLHKEQGLSFENVITFNLDEYLPIEKEDSKSYFYFMHEHLFNHVDIKPENINIPRGDLKPEEIADFCASYEKKIDEVGGLDFQLLGIGRTGHIGFNEPGSNEKSKTRMVTLDHITRSDAAGDFKGLENVPRTAITMGIDTIKKAKRIVLMAWGGKKAPMVKETVEGKVTAQIPSTFLQDFKNVTIVLDPESSSELIRFKTPWVVDGHYEWNDEKKMSAVVWLSQTVGKPILKLTEKDYNNHDLSLMLTTEESVYDLNIRLFKKLQRTITGWPGGKPGSDDSKRPERALPAKKRVILFSPHPDDDVISMGGTFMRLVEQGHDVHVAYQTSGNVAVTNNDALRFTEFSRDLATEHGLPTEKYESLIKTINGLDPNEIPPMEIRKIKGLIRKGEAIAGARYSGLRDDQIHFLNLPFYETGKAKKNPVGEADIEITMKLIDDIKPHQVYAAGDLADPHGTHKVCLEAIFEAMARLKEEKDYMKDCWLWLYRGAWHEWPIHEIHMAVPLSPKEVLRKRQAIFTHQSQKDGAMFQGDDKREFWQRAEDRNSGTAKAYNDLGLTEYEAIEAFRRWDY